MTQECVIKMGLTDNLKNCFNKLKTWKDIRSFDDIVNEGEKRVMSRLAIENQKQCHFLEKEGKFFYYCGKDLSTVQDKTPSPSNPIYQKHVGLTELQLYCTKGGHEKCIVYRNNGEE